MMNPQKIMEKSFIYVSKGKRERERERERERDCSCCWMHSGMRSFVCLLCAFVVSGTEREKEKKKKDNAFLLLQ
jgi:hypothetical protein